LTRKLYILSGVLSVLVSVNVFFIFSFQKEGTGNSSRADASLNSTQAYIFPISEPSYLPVLNTAAERPQLTAMSAIVYDTRSSRYLYSKNSDVRLPIASLTKILAAVVVVENLNLDDIVIIPEEVLRVDGEKQTLYLDERVRVRDLLKMALIESSNDAAYALKYHASKLGIDMLGLMNKKAVELGMHNSIFHDPAGLNDDALSTSEDLVKLVKYSLKFDELWSVLGEKTTSVYSVDGKIEHTVKSTNQLLGVIPDVVGGKTGYTEKALGCMLLVVDVPGKNDKLVSIILGSTERFTDTEKLINWVKRAHTW
jgi:serine-type D-Ala-D-Ala carboxypeptidase (penicillin-binding protein 5/6)